MGLRNLCLISGGRCYGHDTPGDVITWLGYHLPGYYFSFSTIFFKNELLNQIYSQDGRNKALSPGDIIWFSGQAFEIKECLSLCKRNDISST